MSKATFMEILSRVEPQLMKADLVGDVVPPRKRLAVALPRFIHGDYYKTIAEMYGIGETTAATICNDVSWIIVHTIWSRYIDSLMPHTAESMEFLQRQMQFPYAFAAVDGCHIPVKCPPGGADARKATTILRIFTALFSWQW